MVRRLVFGIRWLLDKGPLLTGGDRAHWALEVLLPGKMPYPLEDWLRPAPGEQWLSVRIQQLVLQIQSPLEMDLQLRTTEPLRWAQKKERLLPKRLLPLLFPSEQGPKRQAHTHSLQEGRQQLRHPILSVWDRSQLPADGMQEQWDINL